MLEIEKVGGYLTGKQVQVGKQCDWCCYYYPESNFTEDIYKQNCNGCERFTQRHYYDLGSLSVRFINGERFRVFTPADDNISDDEIDAKIRKDYFGQTVV